MLGTGWTSAYQALALPEPSTQPQMPGNRCQETVSETRMTLHLTLGHHEWQFDPFDLTKCKADARSHQIDTWKCHLNQEETYYVHTHSQAGGEGAEGGLLGSVEITAIKVQPAIWDVIRPCMHTCDQEMQAYLGKTGSVWDWGVGGGRLLHLAMLRQGAAPCCLGVLCTSLLLEGAALSL